MTGAVRTHGRPPARDRFSTSRLLALGGLGLGAVLALVAGSRPWWRAAGTGVSIGFSGTEATAGLAQALALVVLAGALLALVLRARGRQVLGGLLVLAAAGMVVLGLLRPRPASGTVQSKVLQVTLADQFALVGTPWPYVYAVAGLLAAAAALLTLGTAPRWPTRTARFERGTGPTAAAAVAQHGTEVGDVDPATLWRSLDAGFDPTADGVEDGRAGSTRAASTTSERADVHEQTSGVTMKQQVQQGETGRTGPSIPDDEQPTV